MQNYTSCITTQPPAELHNRLQNSTTTRRTTQPPAEFHNHPRSKQPPAELHNRLQNYTTTSRTTQPVAKLHILHNYTTTCRTTRTPSELQTTRRSTQPPADLQSHLQKFALISIASSFNHATANNELDSLSDTISNYKIQLHSIIFNFNVHLFLRNVHYRFFRSVLSPQRCLHFPFVLPFIPFPSTIPQH